MSAPHCPADSLRPDAAHLTPEAPLHPPDDGLPPEAWFGEPDEVVPAAMPWLWEGYLAPGNVTLLTSQGKLGKTTLLSVLLARLKTGGPLLGLTLAAGKALLVSEESEEIWKLRGSRLGYGDYLCRICRPFPGKPTPAQWRALLDRIARLQARHRFALVAIDPLSHFLPGHDENNAGTMLEHLLQLRSAAADAALLLNHHPRRKEAPAGQTARGSGALTSCSDIVLELRWYRNGAEVDRRRRLCGWSRHEQTPRQLVIELADDGRDYLCHSPPDDDEYATGWQAVGDVLARAEGKLTQKEILHDWPEGLPPPGETTLWRWLDRAVAQGLLCRDGHGRKTKPYRYWLAAQEKRWLEDPDYRFKLMIEETMLQQQEALRQMGMEMRE